MADNRIAYGLAKKYGIDTKGMSPKEVWDALNEKGVTRENAAEKSTSDGNGGTHVATEAEKKRLKDIGIEETDGTSDVSEGKAETSTESKAKGSAQGSAGSLTKRDWARFYKTLGEIKSGGYVVKDKNGNKYIPLYKMSDSDVPKIICCSGTYENPKVINVFEFNSEDNLNIFMEEL